MTPSLLFKDIQVTFGDKPILVDGTITIYPRDRICLVGRNGCGKSTLMKVVAGIFEPDNVDRFIQPGTQLSYLPQDPVLPKDVTVFDYIAAGIKDFDENQAHIVQQMGDSLQLNLDQLMNHLSGGQVRRVALARALVSDPDILLLDEPTNHLDIETIQWLEAELQSFRGAVVVISHDKTFLKNITQKTIWLDRGVTRVLDKGFGHFEEWRANFLDQEARQIEKLDKLISQETEWSHQGITARRKRNQGRLRRLHQLRQVRADHVKYAAQKALASEIDDIGSKEVLVAKHVSKHYGDRVIIQDCSLRVLRGDRIGIVGPNGAGKSTLINLLTKNMEPDQGHVRLAKNLEMTYLDQARIQLDPKKTLWDTLTQGGGDHIWVQGHSRHVVAYLKDFQFSDKQARAPVGSLSGGEKNRLLLAMALAKSSNFLVLDEPTNDLDVDTLELLEDMLANYPGTILLVSHDRDFLDQVVHATLFIERDGHVTEYAGGYTDAMAQRGNKGQQSPLQVKSAKNQSAHKENKPSKSIAKLSYKQAYRLEELEKRLPQLTQTIRQLEEELADPRLYNENPERFDVCAHQLTQTQRQLQELEEEWCALQELKEQLESSSSSTENAHRV